MIVKLINATITLAIVFSIFERVLFIVEKLSNYRLIKNLKLVFNYFKISIFNFFIIFCFSTT